MSRLVMCLLMKCLLMMSAAQAAEPLRVLCGVPGVAFPPFYEWNLGADTPIGRDSKLVAALARELGRAQVYVTLSDDDWHEVLAQDPHAPTADYRVWALVHGRADIVVSCFTITQQRSQVIDFSHPYAIDGLGVLVASDSEIKGLPDLAHSRVHAETGTTAAVWAKNNLPQEAWQTEVPRVATPEDLILDGHYDAIVNSVQWLSHLSKSHDGLTLLPQLIDREQLGVGVAPGQRELVAAINGALEQLQANGALGQIYGQHAIIAV